MLQPLSLAVFMATASARGVAPRVPGCSGLADGGEPEGAVIDRVEVRVGDVFDADPAEEHRFFRWVNRLHRKTRDGVIRNQLLFEPGDRYTRRSLDESERLLRGDAYLYDATIRPTRCHDGDRVDVEVDTRDVWTLGGGVSFGHRGGASSTRFKVEDTNFLGTGKLVALEHGTTVDRTSSSLRFRDPALLGTRFELGLGYADTSDGSSLSLELGRPFFALDTRWAAAASLHAEDRVDHLWAGGEVVSGFRHQERRWEVSGGLSGGLRDGRAHRWTAGFTFSRDLFSSEDPSSTTLLPEDRTLAYPWIGFEHVEDAYVEESDLDQLGRTEDHFVGRSFAARLGFSSAAWGGDDDRAVFDARGQLGWRFGDRQLFDVAGSASGRFGSSVENLLVEASARYYARDFGRHVFFAGLAAAWGERLDLDRPLYLGGEDGLRGYPLRYQAGDRRFLLTLEQRFMTDWELFHLFRVGAAAFLDLGRAWSAGEPGGGVLADLGVGLRLGHLRSGRGSVLHLDLAFPLRDGGSIDSVQWLVSTKRSF